MDRKRRADVHSLEFAIKRCGLAWIGDKLLNSKFQGETVGHRITRFYQRVIGPFILQNIVRHSFVPASLRYDVDEFNKNEYRHLHPVEFDDSVAKYVGVFPASIWFRPAAVIPRKIDVPKEINIPDEVREKLNLQAVVGGSWPTNCHHAARYMSEDKDKLCFEDYREAIHQALLVMPAFKCDMPVRDEMIFNNVKGVASAGVVSGLFTANKAESSKWAYEVAKWIWNDINNFDTGTFKEPSLYSGGGRARRHALKWTGETVRDAIEKYDPTTCIDSRLVQSPEYPSQLVQVAWQSKFALFFHNVRINNGSWVYLGQSFAHNGWKRLFEFVGRTCLEGDWSDFDVRVYVRDAIIGFAVIYSFFPNTHKTMRFMIYSCVSFCCRNFVVPGGEMYLTKKGVPSGSIWTSDIDTIINIVKWCYLILNDPWCIQHGYKPVDFLGAYGGDDFVLAAPKGVKSLPVRGFKQMALDLWDWNIKEPVVSDYINDIDSDESISFFKVCLNKVLLPTIRVPELIKRVNSPERKPRGEWDKWYSQATNVPAPGPARDAFITMVRAVANRMSSSKAKDYISSLVGFELNVMDITYLKYYADESYRNITCTSYEPGSQLFNSGSGGTNLLSYLHVHQMYENIHTSEEIAEAYKQIYYYERNRPQKVSKLSKEMLNFKVNLKAYKKKLKAKAKRLKQRYLNLNVSHSTPISCLVRDTLLMVG